MAHLLLIVFVHFIANNVPEHPTNSGTNESTASVMADCLPYYGSTSGTSPAADGCFISGTSAYQTQRQTGS